MHTQPDPQACWPRQDPAQEGIRCGGRESGLFGQEDPGLRALFSLRPRPRCLDSASSSPDLSVSFPGLRVSLSSLLWSRFSLSFSLPLLSSPGALEVSTPQSTHPSWALTWGQKGRPHLSKGLDWVLPTTAPSLPHPPLPLLQAARCGCLPRGEPLAGRLWPLPGLR